MDIQTLIAGYDGMSNDEFVTKMHDALPGYRNLKTIEQKLLNHLVREEFKDALRAKKGHLSYEYNIMPKRLHYKQKKKDLGYGDLSDDQIQKIFDIMRLFCQ